MFVENNCVNFVPPKSNTKAVAPTFKSGLRTALATVSLWRAKANQRRKLKMLLNDPDLLKDIGVSEWDARVEAHKPFWK